MPNILIAEDDPHIRAGLVDTLESEGYRVDSAVDGAQAEALLKQKPYDLAILDIMMPKKDGYAVCQALRQRDTSIAVIMLSAKSEEIDKVLGLKLGADDYVTKPFGVKELLARVESALRRSRQNSNASNTQPTFALGPVTVHRAAFKASHGGRQVDLTSRELKLLEQFHLHPDEVLTRDTLLNQVWGIDYYGTTRTLDQHIAQLRKKLASLGIHHLIDTVHGIGYRLSQN